MAREEWDEKKKAYKPTDMTNGAKNTLASALKQALTKIEKHQYGEERDAFLETSLKNAIKEIENMVIE